MHVVIKPFLGAGVQWDRNQLVDGNQFRNLDNLIGQRFLRAATQPEIDSAYEANDPAPKVEPKKKVAFRLTRRTH